MKCWCTMPMPRSIASRALRISTGRPSTAIVPSSALLQPVEHLHQGALARAVLADQRVDLAPGEVEVDLVVGEHEREALDDAAHLRPRRHAACYQR
jgi:hypothetical protein